MEEFKSPLANSIDWARGEALKKFLSLARQFDMVDRNNSQTNLTPATSHPEKEEEKQISKSPVAELAAKLDEMQSQIKKLRKFSKSKKDKQSKHDLKCAYCENVGHHIKTVVL